MGTAASAIAMGVGLAHADSPRPVVTDALLDADFQHGRFGFAGQSYANEAAFLAAVGGVKSGITRTIGPAVTGAELLANGSFDTNVTGWSAGGGANAMPAWAAGQLQVSIPGPSPTDNRFGRSVSLTVGKAYRFTGRPAQSYAANQGSVVAAATLLATTRSSVPAPFTAGQPYTGYVGAEQTTLHIGANTNGTVPRTEQWDDFSVREAMPMPGHNYQALSVAIRAVAPAVASGNKVLFQADDAATIGTAPAERNRLRIVWDASKHLRLIVTQAGTEQANIDLGVVETDTAFEVAVSSAANAFKANLDGGPILRDTGGTHPPLAVYRIGRSQTGETWDGSIHRITIRAAEATDISMVHPERAFAVYGDSTARGDGGTPAWHETLRTAYVHARTVYNAGASGQSTGPLRDGLLADTDHRRWTTIIMDRPNTGESGATWLANVKAAVANLRTIRWLVVPPVLNSPSGLPDASSAAILDAQAALLADPFFAGHSFDAAAQVAYLAACNDDATRAGGGDYTHFGNAGQAMQAAHIKAFLDTRGW